jgi:hypothetical protein
MIKLEHEMFTIPKSFMYMNTQIALDEWNKITSMI